MQRVSVRSTDASRDVDNNGHRSISLLLPKLPGRSTTYLQRAQSCTLSYISRTAQYLTTHVNPLHERRAFPHFDYLLRRPFPPPRRSTVPSARLGIGPTGLATGAYFQSTVVTLRSVNMVRGRGQRVCGTILLRKAIDDLHLASM